MAAIQLNVTGMTCGHCKKHVEEALKGVPGVFGVFVDLDTGATEVDCDEGVARQSLIEAVHLAGYEAQPVG